MQNQGHAEAHALGHCKAHDQGGDEGRELMRKRISEEACGLRCGASPERCGGSHEQGMVTSEIALGLLPISFIMILLLVIASFMTAYLQAQSMSYAVARNAAVGKSYDASSLEVSGANKASIDVGREGKYVVVTASVEPVGVLGWLDVRASSTISVPVEPGVLLP